MCEFNAHGAEESVIHYLGNWKYFYGVIGGENTAS